MIRRFKPGDVVITTVNYAHIGRGSTGVIEEEKPGITGLLYIVDVGFRKGLYYENELIISKEHYLNEFYEAI